MIRNQALFWENIEKLVTYRTGECTYKLVSQITGVPNSTVARVGRAQQAITLDTAEHLADGLGIELWKLLVPFFDPANEPAAFTKQQENELNAIKTALGRMS